MNRDYLYLGFNDSALPSSNVMKTYFREKSYFELICTLPAKGIFSCGFLADLVLREYYLFLLRKDGRRALFLKIYRILKELKQENIL